MEERNQTFTFTPGKKRGDKIGVPLLVFDLAGESEGDREDEEQKINGTYVGGNDVGIAGGPGAVGRDR